MSCSRCRGAIFTAASWSWELELRGFLGKPFFKIDSSKKKNCTLVNRRDPHIFASTVGSQLLSKDFKDCYRSNSIEIGLEASLVSGLLTQQVRQFLSPSSSNGTANASA
jgi:hypothetical protein